MREVGLSLLRLYSHIWSGRWADLRVDWSVISYQADKHCSVLERQNQAMDTGTVRATMKIPSNTPKIGFIHLILRHPREQG